MSVILKVLFSALVLVASAEVAKRSGIRGALIIALPFEFHACHGLALLGYAR